jgi:hypothetical protein
MRLESGLEPVLQRRFIQQERWPHSDTDNSSFLRDRGPCIDRLVTAVTSLGVSNRYSISARLSRPDATSHASRTRRQRGGRWRSRRCEWALRRTLRSTSQVCRGAGIPSAGLDPPHRGHRHKDSEKRTVRYRQTARTDSRSRIDWSVRPHHTVSTHPWFERRGDEPMVNEVADSRTRLAVRIARLPRWRRRSRCRR